jgi:hypothetical protein
MKMETQTRELPKPAPGYRWNADRVRELNRHYVAGLKLVDIARAMSLPYQMVRDKIRSMEGLPSRPNGRRTGAVIRDHGQREPEWIERNCLCCGKAFQADGRFQRLCATHRVQG